MEMITVSEAALNSIKSMAARVQAERDELLAALQFMLDSDVNGWDVLPARERAYQAIEKATKS